MGAASSLTQQKFYNWGHKEEATFRLARGVETQDRLVSHTRVAVENGKDISAAKFLPEE